MYIQVRLLNGFREPLLYKIPDSWHKTQSFVGALVRVPLRNQKVPALVIEELQNKPTFERSFAVREACDYEAFPNDKHYYKFIKQLAHYYQIHEVHFVKRIKQFLIQKEQPATVNTITLQPSAQKITLTTEQQTIYDFLRPHIQEPVYMPSLIHGVTGSGKTEVYKRLIIDTINAGRTALLLLPEVTLALRFEQILRKQLPSNIAIYSFHSGTSVKEKRKAWQRLINGEPILIIGVHLPVLLPIQNLGLIIVDEEHDGGYQEKRHPMINSKEAAILRAHITNIPIVLGSATPSIASLHNVHTRGWKLFHITKRYAGAFPTIKTVPLIRKEKRKNFWITSELEDAIAQRLHNNEQTIIFLNRRGHSFFLQCKQCSYIPACTACSVSLTVHAEGFLSCHYCGYRQFTPVICPECRADEKKLLKKGIGTQQVITILEKLFPHARIRRADMDTSANKKEWRETIESFESGTTDILVGTQTITKGYHFPNVTLVGILWADLNLHFPMYNASETTLQQLIQVAGRAGRQREKSTVIVQYMANHAIFAYLNEQQYTEFYEQEMIGRKELNYPPFQRLVEIALRHSDDTRVSNEAAQIAHALRKTCDESIQVLGPTKPPVHKIKNMHTRTIYLKGEDINAILSIIEPIRTVKFSCSIFITPNPLHM